MCSIPVPSAFSKVIFRHLNAVNRSVKTLLAAEEKRKRWGVGHGGGEDEREGGKERKKEKQYERGCASQIKRNAQSGRKLKWK